MDGYDRIFKHMKVFQSVLVWLELQAEVLNDILVDEALNETLAAPHTFLSNLLREFRKHFDLF